MNRPDEKTLNSWLEGELEGDALRKVEAWAEAHAGDLDAEFKCEIGWNALNDEKLSSLSESVEPPYPEFFNSKIQQSISGEISNDDHVVAPSFWQKLRLVVAPAAIAALVAFYAGTQMRNASPTQNGIVATEESSVYVPHSGIIAAVSDTGDATEIVLDGLTPISDDLDIAAGETSPGVSPMMANTEEEEVPYLFF